jgi:ribosome-binding protein aMBF1 (putative translation factor)
LTIQSESSGIRLRIAREQIGWSKRQLAAILVRSESSIRAIEDGTYSPSMDVIAWIERLADAHRENPPPLKIVGDD